MLMEIYKLLEFCYGDNVGTHNPVVFGVIILRVLMNIDRGNLIHSKKLDRIWLELGVSRADN